MYDASQFGIVSVLLVPHEMLTAFFSMMIDLRSQKQNKLCLTLLDATDPILNSANNENSPASIGNLTSLNWEKAFPSVCPKPFLLQFKAIPACPFCSTHSVFCLSLQVFNTDNCMALYLEEAFANTTVFCIPSSQS